MTDKQPEARSDIDKICSAVMADTDALEDAKMTLEVIKETDPGVYDEMINDTLALIRKALSSSILGVIEKTDAELRRLHEEVQQWQEKCNTYMELHDAVVKDSDRLYALNAELVEAVKAALSDDQPYIEKCKAALAKAQGDNNGQR